MIPGFPLSMAGYAGFAPYPLAGRAMLLLSIPVTWGCVVAAVSTLAAMLPAVPRP